MSLITKLKNKQLTIGSWLSFGYTPICEIMAKSRFEWLVIDMEHTTIDYSMAQNMIQIIDLAGKSPLVRVGSNNEAEIKRVLDAGAHGIIVPMIKTGDEARQAVSFVKYPPDGIRGVGLSRAQNYGIGFSEYMKWQKEETIVIAQIEHIDAVNNLEDILAVDGIDGFIVGPYDLSASLGCAGEFDHPAVVEALKRVQYYVEHSSKPGGFHVVHSDINLLQSKIESGYTFLAYGDDMVFFAEKMENENLKIEGLNHG